MFTLKYKAYNDVEVQITGIVNFNILWDLFDRGDYVTADLEKGGYYKLGPVNPYLAKTVSVFVHDENDVMVREIVLTSVVHDETNPAEKVSSDVFAELV